MLRILNSFAQNRLCGVRLVLLLIKLRKSASGIKSDIIEALNLLRQGPRLF